MFLDKLLSVSLALSLLSVLATVSAGPNDRKRFDGYKLIEVVPADRRTLQFLHSLMVNDTQMDFWQEPSRVGQSVKFLVPPGHVTDVEQLLDSHSIDYNVEIDDLQRTLLNPVWSQINGRARTRLSSSFDLNNFNKLDDIYTWMFSLVRQCRSGLKCKVYSIGNSYEGRPIYVFKIVKKIAGRRAYWIDATIHAREWITTATIANIMDTMATGRTQEAVELTDRYDWYFLPVMNPDGYAFTWDKNRLWRKNRRPVSQRCFGVDLNRNFNIYWGTDGVSHEPCMETFCGPSGGSEPETHAVSAELVRLGPTLTATITLHSFGNMWMFPFGNMITASSGRKVCNRAADHDDLMRVANAAADAIAKTYSTHWERGNSCEVIYAAAGGTDDYAKGVAGVKYAFCPELRGSYFVVDPSEIQRSFREIWNGVVAMCNAINA